MKVVVQRVKQAKVTIDQKPVGQIGRGLLLLVGLKNGDTLATVEKMANKISKLRIFTDENGKTGRALKDVSGEVLSVSQFTLLANTKKGNRPSFVEAMEPELANKLWQNFNQELIKHGLKVSTGKFGADMQVSLINEGPFTLVLDD